MLYAGGDYTGDIRCWETPGKTLDDKLWQRQQRNAAASRSTAFKRFESVEASQAVPTWPLALEHFARYGPLLGAANDTPSCAPRSLCSGPWALEQVGTGLFTRLEENLKCKGIPSETGPSLCCMHWLLVGHRHPPPSCAHAALTD